MSETTRLRLVQFGCIVLLLTCAGLVYLRRNPDEASLTARHWVVIVAAIWSGIYGFRAQRRLARRSGRSSRSTPLSRWKAGHLLRLWTATSVGVWALILSDWGGPHVGVNGLFAVALGLLLLWSPGPVPAM